MKVLERFALTGKKALVTGDSQGLGKAFASALAEAGARVVIVARDAGRNAAARVGGRPGPQRPRRPDGESDCVPGRANGADARPRLACLGTQNGLICVPKHMARQRR